MRIETRHKKQQELGLISTWPKRTRRLPSRLTLPGGRPYWLDEAFKNRITRCRDAARPRERVRADRSRPQKSVERSQTLCHVPAQAHGEGRAAGGRAGDLGETDLGARTRRRGHERARPLRARVGVA